MSKQLTPEGLEAVEAFELEYEDCGCTCFRAAPCSYCTHPGNPSNVNEIPEFWELADE
jgi:hypothetical protein